MNDKIKIISYKGSAIADLIPQMANLRIEVFHEYPFLYIGDYDYEMRYLKKFQKIKNAIAVAVFYRDEMVGVSTGYPFCYESDELKLPFLNSKRNPHDYFCYGESVLKKSYRGQGLGKEFFYIRESHVRSLDIFNKICFYTIKRSENDSRCPSDYRSPASLWQRQGFKMHPELVGTVMYQEIGETQESPKEMVFWVKELS